MECEESEGRGLRRKGALAVHVDAERLWMACLTSSFDGLAAKPQFPHRMGFEGLIAFHPRTVEALTAQEMYLVAAHELGRLWGIEKHTKNIHSIMYFRTRTPPWCWIAKSGKPHRFSPGSRLWKRLWRMARLGPRRFSPSGT